MCIPESGHFDRFKYMDEFKLLSASWVIRARWREIQRFVRKFKTMTSIHDMQFWDFLFSKTEDIRSKVRQNKFGENGYCRNYFINKSFCHTFPVIPKAQNCRECMETSLVHMHLSCEHELICLVYEGESL